MAEMSLGDGIALLQRRGRLIKGLLVAGFVVLALLLAGQIAELHGLVSLAKPAPVEGLGALYFGVGLADLSLALITSVIFCMWIYRAAANLRSARVPGLAFTPGWAVGWNFVPFANFFKPYQAMSQIWSASHGDDPDDRYRGQMLLACWWGLWSFSIVATIAATQTSIDAATPAEDRDAILFAILCSVVNLLLYPLALCLVDRITAAQRDRFAAAQGPA
ncbi:MAG: DUF4328 domain-containing protein [Sphingopyxis sp.]|nr:DUF4328 domain-containing protein [Sphingopyxis sp.]